jgi:hypothetical protein
MRRPPIITSAAGLGAASLIAASLTALLLAGCSLNNAPDDACGMSFCGCYEEVTLAFEATVVSGQTNDPLPGIELYCQGEAEPIAVSDAAGKIGFNIETTDSPACGPARCGNLRFHDPEGVFADALATFRKQNGADVVMSLNQD